MTKFEHVADEEMVKNAVGDEFDDMAEPPGVEISEHPLARQAVEALRNGRCGMALAGAGNAGMGAGRDLPDRGRAPCGC